MKEALQEAFKLKFHQEPTVLVQAPTRINIIGEHTDYNDGWVMPAAIDKYIYFALVKLDKPLVFIYDENKDEQFYFAYEDDFSLEGLTQWRKYYYGAIDLLKKEYNLGGFKAYKIGTAPVGAGISSSAALCCGFIFAISELFDLKLDRWTIAKLAQRVEQEYVGLQCGIMDQFAVLFGEENHILRLNCFNLAYTKHPVKLEEFQFILCNSMVKHNLADSAYNERVDEMKQIKKSLHLKDFSQWENLDTNQLKSPLKNRLRHLVSANRRVQRMQVALDRNDAHQVGQLLNESHASLQKDYAVTCEETDYLVNALNTHGALGSRQMGGGFGGCILALIPNEKLNDLKSAVSLLYQERFQRELEFYSITLSNGVKRI